jgi:hypothetical protein
MLRYMRIGAFIGLLAGFAAIASAGTSSSRPVPRITPIQYLFQPGDILTYGQVLESENSLQDNRQASYRVRLEWQVKIYVLANEAGATSLAIQYNLRDASISNRAAFERSVGKDKARELLEIYDNAAPELVRFLKIDGLGNNQNGSYDLNTASSSIFSFMTQIRRLPGIPYETGDTFLSEEEDALNIVYRGEQSEPRGTAYIFTADHPSGRVQLAVNKELGVPDRLEYKASYIAENQLRREGYSLVFREKRNIRWPGLLMNPQVNKALVLGALARPELVFGREVISSFLDSRDPERQNLGAAYCGLRGIPEGLDLTPYLKSANPIVRFNAAKAFLKYRGEAGPLRSLTMDPDAYVRRRAVNFFERSTYMIPGAIQPLYLAVQRWLYADGTMPSVGADQGEEIRQVLQFIKPVNAPAPGFSKNFLDNPKDLQHPYYMYLPEDYDPAEVYPAFVYLGMGDGRGDYALNAVVTGLKKAGRMSRYILLVPQAHGLWWDPSAEGPLNRVLLTFLHSVSADTNQIYLGGSSNGGMGTMFYGTHLPDRFAAVASNMGYPVVDREFLSKPQDLDLLKNLFNAKVFLSHGGDDDQVTPEGDRSAYALLKKGPLPVTYVELPGKGHDIPIADVLAKALAVFDSRQRDPFPKRIDFTMNEQAYAACYWIEIEDYSALPARVTARIQGNTVDVESAGVRQMKLSLDDNLVDLSKPVTVRVNGKEIFRGPLRASAQGLLWSAKERMDAQLGYSVTLDLNLSTDAGRL